MFTKDLEMCLMAAQSEAIDRRHEYLCVEHILYALLHNDAGLNVIKSCGGDTNLIKQDLEDFFSQQEEINENKLPRQTKAVQRVLHLAIMHVNSSGKASADVGDVLVAIHRESRSYASYFLQKQEISRLDLLNYISHGIAKVPAEEEKVTIDFAFSTVVSIKDISKGEKFSEDNIWVKRPGTGEIKAEFYKKVLGKISGKSIKKGIHIKWSDCI